MRIGNRRHSDGCSSQVVLCGEEDAALQLIAQTRKASLSYSKIGELTFCPPYKSADFFPSSPGELDAEVFVSNESFDRLANSLSCFSSRVTSFNHGNGPV